MGPSGLPPTFTTFRHFFFPHLGLHSGAGGPAPWQVTAAPSQPCRPCQATRGTWVPPVGPGCHQTGLGAASVTQVLPMGPGCHQTGLGAASGTWVTPEGPRCHWCNLGTAKVT